MLTFFNINNFFENIFLCLSWFWRISIPADVSRYKKSFEEIENLQSDKDPVLWENKQEE